MNRIVLAQYFDSSGYCTISKKEVELQIESFQTSLTAGQGAWLGNYELITQSVICLKAILAGYEDGSIKEPLVNKPALTHSAKEEKVDIEVAYPEVVSVEFPEITSGVIKVSRMDPKLLLLEERYGSISPPIFFGQFVRTELKTPVPEGFINNLGLEDFYKTAPFIKTNSSKEKGEYLIEIPDGNKLLVQVGSRILSTSNVSHVSSPTGYDPLVYRARVINEDEPVSYTVDVVDKNSPSLIVEKDLFIPSLQEQKYWEEVLPLPEKIQKQIEEKKMNGDVSGVVETISSFLSFKHDETSKTNFRYILHSDIGDFIRDNSKYLPLIMTTLKMGHCDLLSWYVTSLLRKEGIVAWSLPVLNTTKDGQAFNVACGHVKVAYVDENNKIKEFDPTSVVDTDPNIPKLSLIFIYENLVTPFAEAKTNEERVNVLKRFSEMIESNELSKRSFTNENIAKFIDRYEGFFSCDNHYGGFAVPDPAHLEDEEWIYQALHDRQLYLYTVEDDIAKKALDPSYQITIENLNLVEIQKGDWIRTSHIEFSSLFDKIGYLMERLPSSVGIEDIFSLIGSTNITTEINNFDRVNLTVLNPPRTPYKYSKRFLSFLSKGGLVANCSGTPLTKYELFSFRQENLRESSCVDLNLKHEAEKKIVKDHIMFSYEYQRACREPEFKADLLRRTNLTEHDFFEISLYILNLLISKPRAVNEYYRLLVDGEKGAFHYKEGLDSFYLSERDTSTFSNTFRKRISVFFEKREASSHSYTERREYILGDDLRHYDYAASFKRDRDIVKLQKTPDINESETLYVEFRIYDNGGHSGDSFVLNGLQAIEAIKVLQNCSRKTSRKICVGAGKDFYKLPVSADPKEVVLSLLGFTLKLREDPAGLFLKNGDLPENLILISNSYPQICAYEDIYRNSPKSKIVPVFLHDLEYRVYPLVNMKNFEESATNS